MEVTKKRHRCQCAPGDCSLLTSWPGIWIRCRTAWRTRPLSRAPDNQSILSTRRPSREHSVSERSQVLLISILDFWYSESIEILYQVFCIYA